MKTANIKINEEELLGVIDKILNTEFQNKALMSAIRKETDEKNLSSFRIMALFNLTKKWEDLDINEKIAFIKASKEALNWEVLDLNKIFDNKDLVAYSAFKNDIGKNLDYMFLEDIQKIDDFNYSGRISYETVFNMMENSLWKYNPQTQRPYKIKTIGTRDEIIREIDVDWKNVEKIKELILNGKFEATQIILNIRLDEKNEPNIDFKRLYKNIGDLRVIPNLNIEDNDFTVIEILDGYHRILATVQAYRKYFEETKDKLQGGFDVKIVLRTLEDAREMLRQIFERSDLSDKKYLKDLEVDDYSIFTDLMIEKSEILKNNTEIRYEDVVYLKKLACSSSIKDVIKYKGINVTKISVKNNMTKQIANIIDRIVGLLAEVYYNNDLNYMKENSKLLEINSFIGYTALAIKMIEENYSDEESIAKKLYELQNTEEYNDLKLENKTAKIKQIIEYFESLIEEKTSEVN